MKFPPLLYYINIHIFKSVGGYTIPVCFISVNIIYFVYTYLANSKLLYTHTQIIYIQRNPSVWHTAMSFKWVIYLETISVSILLHIYYLFSGISGISSCKKDPLRRYVWSLFPIRASCFGFEWKNWEQERTWYVTFRSWSTFIVTFDDSNVPCYHII